MAATTAKHGGVEAPSAAPRLGRVEVDLGGISVCAVAALTEDQARGVLAGGMSGSSLRTPSHRRLLPGCVTGTWLFRHTYPFRKDVEVTHDLMGFNDTLSVSDFLVPAAGDYVRLYNEGHPLVIEHPLSELVFAGMFINFDARTVVFAVKAQP